MLRHCLGSYPHQFGVITTLHRKEYMVRNPPNHIVTAIILDSVIIL